MTIEASSLLAGLLAHAERQGVDLLTLRALVEESSQLGAARALQSIGLHDTNASADIGELRELLRAWRDTKKSARTAVVNWIARIVTAALATGLALKFGLAQLLSG
jgi:hypothetical protein